LKAATLCPIPFHAEVRPRDKIVLPDPPLRAARMIRGGSKIIEIKPTSTQKIPLLSPFTKGEEFMGL
jgi:hypothetical protein